MTLLSVMGLYQFDDSIFDVMAVPDGVNKEAAVAAILTECAELEILLPDPDIFKASLQYWSISQLPIWTKLYESTQFDYNPIWNKDATITETRHLETDDTETRNLSKNNTETRNLANSAHTTATGKVAGYNSTTLQTQEQQDISGNGTDTGTVENNGSDTGTVNNAGEHDETITRRETGNIGITSTQELIEAQRNVVQFDIYKYIVQSFKSMYCLGVY